ncbi:MAG: hypothetical protein U9Q03_04540 [Patescibacteria group bacterium]|nr:hypothetical protein [Patescibacteria group bacterium]
MSEEGGQDQGSPPKPALPAELQGVAREKDVTDLEERLGNRIDKCYTHEDYEGFQYAVGTIVLDKLGSDDGVRKIKDKSLEVLASDEGTAKIKDKSLDAMQSEDGQKKMKEVARQEAVSVFDEKSWKSRSFWVPTIISSIAAIAAITALLVK